MSSRVVQRDLPRRNSEPDPGLTWLMYRQPAVISLGERRRELHVMARF